MKLFLLTISVFCVCIVAEDDCKFPFRYKGELNFNCTKQDSNKFWCSLDEEFNGRRKYCATPHDNCVSHFRYKGKEYSKCTKVNSIAPWCSLDEEYNGSFEYCETQGDCVFPFNYGGKTFDKCTSVNWHTTPWCSLDKDYDGNFKSCTTGKKVANIYTYSPDLILLIGKPLKHDWVVYGPLQSLDDSGKYRFDPSEGSSEKVDQNWKKIAAGSWGSINSHLILLPNHWGGMIIDISIQSRNENEFKIYFEAAEVAHNEGIKYPQSFKVQMQMDLLNKERYFSNFVVFKATSMRAQALIQGIPLKNVDPRKLPKIRFQFKD